MDTIKFVIVGLSALIVTACGNSAESVTKAEEPPEKIFEHQIEALDKAKDVEQMIFDADAQRRKTLEEMEM